MDIIRDSIWQFIGVVVALLTIFIFYFYRKRKGLAYRTQIFTLMRINELLKSELKIKYRGRKVNDLDLITIRLMNSGNQPILLQDFVTPLEISLPVKTKIINAEVSNSNPKGLNTSLSFKSNLIILNPLLLNQKDWININALVSNFNGDIDIQGRVVGVKEIRHSKPITKYVSVLKYGSYLLCIGFAGPLLDEFVRDSLSWKIPAQLPIFFDIIFVLGIALIFFGIIRAGQLSFENIDK